jgi:hypothetical protein
MAFQQQLLAAIGDEHGTEAANRLCEACVALFEVDAAAISVVFDGINKGTLGASGPPARVYDELGGCKAAQAGSSSARCAPACLR